MEDVHNLINIGPTDPIQILSQHEIFWRFCMCPSSNIFDRNKKILKSVPGLNSKDRMSTRDKANISNPKVNRSSQPTAPQQTVWKFHLDPQYHIFHWGIQRYVEGDRGINFQIIVGYHHISLLMVNMVPILDQRGPTTNQFWVFTRQVYRQRLGWIDYFFYITVGNPRRTDRPHAHKDAQTPTIPMPLPDFVGGNREFITASMGMSAWTIWIIMFTERRNMVTVFQCPLFHHNPVFRLHQCSV